MIARKQLIRIVILCLVALYSVSTSAQDGDPVRGQKLFRNLGCQTCHTVRGVGGPSGSGGATETKAPDLAVSPEGGPFFGSTVELSDGQKVEVTDAYLLDSITKPAAAVVIDHETGRPYPADKMPDRFKHLPPQDLASLVTYIKSLSGVVGGGATADPTVSPGPELGGVTDHGSAESLFWIWAVLAACTSVVALASIVKMSRTISWPWIGGIVSVPVLGAVAGLFIAHHGGGGAEREIAITARQFAYDPPIINVNRGDRVTITLTSTDVLHGLYIDGYGIDKEIRPGEKVRFSFTANKPGKFPYRCSHTCGVFHPFMIGNLIVSPNYLFHASVGLCFGLGLATFLYIANKKE
ncbi:MAG: cupredoxin domain-containing protein [Pirellulaceae bacterium]|jgi:plastocyanin|nr:cupredoxin domain-containing protein [Pirellulaceae bacterium]